jgi:lipopolysaccharide/colanic/teichoic acid biosynthesis glycosyltransferase
MTGGNGSRQPSSVPDELMRELDAAPQAGAKRLLDVVVAGLALAVLWPVWILTMVLITLDSPGRVLVRQKRVGLGGKLFDFYKFRTMVPGSHNDISDRIPQGDLSKQLLSPRRRNPNVTTIGWVLRKTTMDELPQLLNVVTGNMSLVGPRPDIPEIVARWPAHFLRRHRVKPGMTGLAQVNGRSDLTHYEKIRYDLEYVRRHPIGRDLAILMKTVALVLSKKGAR